jgi:hypothetical protein
MRTEPLTLSDEEFSELQRSTPDNGSGSAVGLRATQLARIYLARLYPCSEGAPVPPGADIALKHREQIISFEIKGTRDTRIAPGQLKVSSLHSYKSLIAGTPVLRITGVFERTPIIYTMLYGTDFTLRPEPRWSVHLTK